jgi:branched-chain amino acid transport system permease protein
MRDIAETIIGGLVVGSVYALIALGMSLIYSISKVINLSQGAFVVLAALTGVSFQHSLHISGPVLLVVVAVTFAVVLAVVDLAVIRPGARRASPDRMLLITVGLLQAIGGFLLLRWGNLPYTMRPFSRTAIVTVAGLRLSTQFFWVLGILLLSLVAMWLLLRRSGLGLRMRATAQDPQAAALMGIDVDKVRLIAFSISGALAAAAGVAIIPLTFLQYDTVVPYAVDGFVAAVLGGLGSSSGAVMGGLLLGVVQGVLQRYTNASLAEILAIGSLILILLLRPAGLRGTVAETRR